MATRKKDPADDIPILRIKKGDSLKAIYAKVRRAFTAADLARYAEDEECIPAEEVIAQLEAIHKEQPPKPAKRQKKAQR